MASRKDSKKKHDGPVLSRHHYSGPGNISSVHTGLVGHGICDGQLLLRLCQVNVAGLARGKMEGAKPHPSKLLTAEAPSMKLAENLESCRPCSATSAKGKAIKQN